MPDPVGAIHEPPFYIETIDVAKQAGAIRELPLRKINGF